MTGCERKSDPVIDPETVASRGRHSACQRCVTKLLGLTALLLAATPACGLKDSPANGTSGTDSQLMSGS